MNLLKNMNSTTLMSYNTLRQVTSRVITWQSKLYNINVVELMFFNKFMIHFNLF